MDISIFLAKVLGIYLLVASIAFFVHTKKYKTIITDIKNSPALLCMSGALALITGLLIVVSHNIWTMDWRVVITILGWLSLIKGFLRLVFPQVSHQVLTRYLKNSSAYYFSASIMLILGVYLSYFGFMS